MSDDLISRRALYERAATLEAQALDYVGKLIERDGEETKAKWKIWSAILIERTAFKRDVYDAPSAQRTGRWIWDDEGYHCTECFYHAYNATGEIMTGEYKFCPNCGAQMEVEE